VTNSSALTVQTVRVVSSMVSSARDVLSPRAEQSVRSVIDGLRLDGDPRALGQSVLGIATRVLASHEERAALSGASGGSRRSLAAEATTQYVSHVLSYSHASTHTRSARVAL
jgi:hypothetical protein